MISLKLEFNNIKIEIEVSNFKNILTNFYNVFKLGVLLACFIFNKNLLDQYFEPNSLFGLLRTLFWEIRQYPFLIFWKQYLQNFWLSTQAWFWNIFSFWPGCVIFLDCQAPQKLTHFLRVNGVRHHHFKYIFFCWKIKGLFCFFIKFMV